VCVEGAPLDSDQAKLLQLLGIKMALFRLTLRCRWSEGEFEPYE
jgi:mRNA turnover protein 4